MRTGRVAFLGLLLALLAGCGGERPGTVVEVSDVSAEAKGSVALPVGRVAVAIGEVEDGLTAEEAGKARSGHFVGVRTDLAFASVPSKLALPLSSRVRPTTMTLVADGKRHELKPPYTVSANGRGWSGGNRDLYVAVDGEPKAITLEFDTAGLKQTVDARTGAVDAGRAAELLNPPGYGVSPPCPSQRPNGGRGVDYGAITCTFDLAVLLPHVGAVGTAEPGRAFAVVALRTALKGASSNPHRDFRSGVFWRPRTGPGRALYQRVGLGEDRITMGGAGPVATLNASTNDSNGDRFQELVFEVDADDPPPLRIEQTYAATSTDTEGGLNDYPAALSIRFRATVDLGL